MRSLSVDIVIPETVFEAVTADAGGEPARQWIVQELTVLLSDCGVVARLEVRLGPASAPLRGQPIRVSVDGRLCPAPLWVLPEALAYAGGSPAVSPAVSAEDLAAVGSPAQLYEALGLAVRAAIGAQPEVLVPSDDPLAAVLGLGMSIAGEDLDALREELRSGGIEPVLERLAAPALELLIEPEYLRFLTAGGAGGELFPFMREGLVVELGLIFPPMHVRLDPTLRPGGFAVRVNGFRTLPRIGLAAGTICVNDQPSRLRVMGVEAEAATNPATHQPGSITGAGGQEMLEAGGFTVWDPFGYYILALAAVVRAQAARLMTPAYVGESLEQLSRAFPAVTAEFTAPLRLSKSPSPRARSEQQLLGPLLRSLLAEQISIRNLRQILQLVVRHSAAPELTESLDLSTFVRAGLAGVIANTAARGSGVVVVYLLDPEFERELGEWADRGVPAEPTLAEDLRAALSVEMGHLPAAAQVPSLLTTRRCRATAHDVLRTEFPSVRVLSYQDIPEHYNIQPVARISR